MIECPRRPRPITERECCDIILGTATSAVLQTCLMCEHGRALAESCPIKPRRPMPVAVDPAPAAAAAPDLDTATVADLDTTPAPAPAAAPVVDLDTTPAPAPKKAARKPRAPKPTPGPTPEQEKETLREVLAHLVDGKHKSLGVLFVARVAARFGFSGDVFKTAEAAGLTVKKEKGVWKIAQDAALADFVKQV